MRHTLPEQLTICELILGAQERLAFGHHPERARFEAELLLLHILQQHSPQHNRAWLIANWNYALLPGTQKRLSELVARRAAGEPIQYITGETEFYGLPFQVTPDVLIPRPETEHLVEKVIGLAATFQSPRIVDVGTGSGAIAISLAHASKKPGAPGLDSETWDSTTADRGTQALKGHDFSRAEMRQNNEWALAPEGSSSPTITATDLSAPALTIARENATRNQAAIRFLQGDLLAPVVGESFDLVVSNPPYVPEPDRPTLAVEVRDHEPAIALFAGSDGLDIYRRLIPQAFACLVPGGFLVLEIGYGQSPAIEALLTCSGFQNIGFVPDLQQIPRVATAQRP